MHRFQILAQTFFIPIVVILGTIGYGILLFLHIKILASLIILSVIVLGSYRLVVETAESLLRKQFALDYIAILAIIVSILTQQYLVGAILALMVATGKTLEDYGVAQAKKSLTGLVDRIPADVTLWENGSIGKKVKLHNVVIGDEVFVHKGEVIGLDGILLSRTGETDESSLTGEPYFIEKIKGDIIRSGTINIGQPMVLRVTKTEKDSTYRKIINMVQEAENEKSPMVRIADNYSTVFTLITLMITVFAYTISHHDLSRVLAVLAVATPCPLIIATPIALLGGVNASAKRKIIVKKLAALESLSRVNAILFDKTGTITFGTPALTRVLVDDPACSQTQALAIASAIERNSLHPLAKAIVAEAKGFALKVPAAQDVKEITGSGISAKIGGKSYLLTKVEGTLGMAIALMQGSKRIAVFQFADEVKEDSRKIISTLKEKGFLLKILTGDKKEAAHKVISQLGVSIDVHAECTPEDKRKEIAALKKEKKVTAMVGDGINDAPALALADVGMAFSNQEQTAASEAADIVFLGGDFSMVLTAWKIAVRTVHIARESILWGIGLSILAMLFASVGIVPPLAGAGLQEAIDVAVILNALRASR